MLKGIVQIAGLGVLMLVQGCASLKYDISVGEITEREYGSPVLSYKNIDTTIIQAAIKYGLTWLGAAEDEIVIEYLNLDGLNIINSRLKHYQQSSFSSEDFQWGRDFFDFSWEESKNPSSKIVRATKITTKEYFKSSYTYYSSRAGVAQQPVSYDFDIKPTVMISINTAGVIFLTFRNKYQDESSRIIQEDHFIRDLISDIDKFIDKPTLKTPKMLQLHRLH